MFRDPRTGRFRQCRVRQLDEAADDPIMVASGCFGEFVNDARKRDLRDGCPRCWEEVIANASEPDGWELRP